MRFEFAGCALDAATYTLVRDGQPITVEPQVFDLLHTLASQAGNVVTKDDLIEAVWAGRIVSDATISARVSAARAAVGDTGRNQKIIRTVSRRGFQMVAEVKAIETLKTERKSEELQQVIRYTTAPDGGSIAWASAGEGPPVLYCWHHFSHLELDWSSSLLSPALVRLAKKHRLIRFDIRGAGFSDPIPSNVTLDDCVAEMKAVADAADLDQFPIIATLQAAAVAIRFAARYPERVSRLVLHNPYAMGRAVRPNAPDNAEHDPFISLLKSSGWSDPEDGFMRAWATMVLPMASPDEITELIRLIAKSVSADAALKHRILIDQFDVMRDLQDVKAPTLVIHARLSSLHPVTEGRRVAAGIPAAEFMEVDSSNTFLIGSDTTFERVMGATLEFLARGT
ncbi:MAG: alpha/beta hydrolase [Yoonia sp.]|uniref:alpha/beta fold hydrolase n=1 Tax=Yoonia sp. TaxID=2212373 RepID=UPI00274009DF|nr:alpha/beta fold hydrolase [Yoonia sp.]MDP5084643.1 alpha/beta hydrolase [Yoonia sp.]